MFDNMSFLKATAISISPVLLLILLVTGITYQADKQYASEAEIVQRALDQGIDPLSLIEATAAGTSTIATCQIGSIESPEKNINGKQYLKFQEQGKNYLKIYTDTPTYTQQHSYQNMTADVVSIEQKIENRFKQLENKKAECETRDIYLSITG